MGDVDQDGRSRWLSGPELREQLEDRAADPGLKAELEELLAETAD